MPPCLFTVLPCLCRISFSCLCLLLRRSSLVPLYPGLTICLPLSLCDSPWTACHSGLGYLSLAPLLPTFLVSLSDVSINLTSPHLCLCLLSRPLSTLVPAGLLPLPISRSHLHFCPHVSLSFSLPSISLCPLVLVTLFDLLRLYLCCQCPFLSLWARSLSLLLLLPLGGFLRKRSF